MVHYRFSAMAETKDDSWITTHSQSIFSDFYYIRWIDNKDIDPKTLKLSSDTKLVKDFRDNYLLLFTSEWNIRWALERNEGLELSEFNRGDLQ